MRISTLQLFDAGSRGILNNQAELYKTQNQLSTGRRFLTPDQDPVGAAQVLLDTQARGVEAQFYDNQTNASAQLALEEDRLKSIVDSIQYIREKVVAGGNAAYSDSQRAFISADLQQQFNYLLGVSNSADASGHYLFSGYQGETQPFQLDTSGAVQYYGDDGQRLLQVGASRQIAVSDSGRDIFVNNKQGNGTFVTAPAGGNTGTGVVSAGTVVNSTLWTGDDYSIQFTGPATYSVTNTTTATLIGSFAYVDGAAITAIPGVTLSIQGAPAVGDIFTVVPSTNQDMFATIKELVDAFNTPIAGSPAAAAAQRNTVVANLTNLDRVLENVSRVQASIGSRRDELRSLANISQDLDVQYQEKISKLQDIDYVETISRFTNQQMQLEAAQQSFAKVSGLSLFNYI